MKYKTEFRLKKGFTIHIDGIPYEYLGNGMVGTNTDLERAYAALDDTIKALQDNK